METWRILHKTSDFTVIDNGIFRDPDLSLAEVGFLCTILSLPEDWDFKVLGLRNILKESTPTIRRIIKALTGHGYCKLVRVVDEKTGRVVKWEYTFFEVKNGIGCGFEPQTKNPHVENPQSGDATSGKVSTIKYYNKSSTNKSNTDKKKDISISKEKFNFLNSLIGIGVSREAAEDWLQVRKTKRATNTRIAFERVAREIAKSGRSADECIRFSVEHSYSGFEAGWLPVGERGDIEDLDDKIRRLNDGTYTV